MSNEAEREAFYAYGESIGMPRLMLTIGEFKAFQAGAEWQREQDKKLVEALENTATWIEQLPVPTVGAAGQLVKIDKAIAAARKGEGE